MLSFTWIAILAAVIPTVCYTLFIWWLDRYEKEPLPLLIAAFLWGALPAILLALLFEVVFAAPVSRSSLGPAATTWMLAPLVEEPVKATALVLLFCFARREFDGPLDGIVYGAIIGFGFSMTENLLYFLSYPDDLGVLFWLRSIFFGFNHALFTGIVGLALGSVRYAPQRWLGYIVLPAGLLLAILFHGLHNAAVGYQLLGLAFSWMVQSSGVITILVIAVLAWKHERTWMLQELGEEIALGIITPADYAAAVSAPRRTRAHLHALLHHGPVRFVRVHRLHHLMTELALCKYQLRIGDRFQHHGERDRLRREIVDLRSELATKETYA